MKKIFTLFLLALSYGTMAQSGCLEALNGQQPFGTESVYCNNEFQNITTFAKAGTFSTVEIGANRTYTFRSSVETDVLTLSNEAGTEIILAGIHSVELTPTTDQVIRFYIHNDDQCGSETTYRTKSVRCDPGPDPNDPVEPVEGCLTTGYPNSINYTPFCSGFPEIMSDFAFTGSYSPVEVTPNTEYTFKSSVETDHITLSNALGTAVIKTGIGEVSWTAAAAGLVQFHIYLDDNCGVGGNEEEPRIVTIQCGEQAPPSEGCLEGPGGQIPVSVFIPVCNTTIQPVAPMANAGDYSMIQVTADNTYTFYSSIDTDMITIGNEEGTEVLGYGIGTFEWTANSDSLIRFYTHANQSCALDLQTRTRSVKCGDPYVATEPDFDCFQGAGLSSNNFEEGFSLSDEIFSVADDFVVAGEFTVQQVRLNILASDPLQNVSLSFLTDNEDMPGEITHSVQNIVPTEQLLIGGANGYFAYQVTVDLPTPLTFTTGKYWLLPAASSDFGAYWEMTSTGTSHSTVRALFPEEDWQPSNYQAVFFISGTCTDLSSGEFEKPNVSFSPNPVKDVLTFSSAIDIEKVIIFNVYGQLINEQIPVGGKINVSDLKSGIYLFKAKLQTGKWETFKIIKE